MINVITVRALRVDQIQFLAVRLGQRASEPFPPYDIGIDSVGLRSLFIACFPGSCGSTLHRFGLFA